MNENPNQKNKPSAPVWSRVQPETFEQIYEQFEKVNPARVYTPLATYEETVSVKIYAPGEEKQEPGRKEKKLALQQRKQTRKLDRQQRRDDLRLRSEELKQAKQQLRRLKTRDKQLNDLRQRERREQAAAERSRLKQLKAEQRRQRKAMMLPVDFAGTVTVSVFLAAFFAIMLCHAFSPYRTYSESENRTLASFPTLSVTSLKNGSFTQGVEKYLSDHFAFRDEIMSLRSSFSKLLGVREQNGVYIGKNERLYKKSAVFDEKKIISTVNAMNTFGKNSKIKHQLFMLVPDASFIIPEDLPFMLKAEKQDEQIRAVYSLADKRIRTVDITSALSECSDRDKLYFRTDHHWTVQAAMIAFQKLKKVWLPHTDTVKMQTLTLSNSFLGTLSSASGVKPVPDTVQVCIPADSAGTYIVSNQSDKSRSTTLFALDKLQTKNQYEVFLGGNFSLLTVTTTNRNRRSLLIFKDSYANCFVPMLTPYFEKIVIIDARYFTSDISRVVKDGNFTHLLYLYSLQTFCEDTSLAQILAENS